MATFTWTATTLPGTTAWETAADWVNTSGSGNPSSFRTAPGNDYIIGSSNLFTINDIGAGGTSAPDIANSLTLTDVAATLLMTDGGGALDVTTTLSLDSLLNMGTAVGGSVLTMGSSGAAGGTISLGSSGRLEGARNDIVQGIGTSVTDILGAGTVIAEGGVFQIGTSVAVDVSDTTQFTILPTATLAFAANDAVNGGTIAFGRNSGSGALDVATLSTFKATVKNPSVGVGSSDVTAFIDFQDAGTAATASLSNLVTNSFSTTATLTVFPSAGGSQSMPLISNFTGSGLNVGYESDGHDGVILFLYEPPCYAAGTAILTPEGEVAVETIQPGDIVMTVEAGRLAPRPVIWTGFRAIDLARHPKPATVAPIRFRAGALDDGLPRRDLLVSPDHCLFIDGGLVPARMLVNGMTIVRDLTVPSVSYHHIELERHALLLAEGAAAESYLDTGNRASFSNAGLATILHPEFAINEHLHCWETDACAPLLTRPEAVRPVWERLAGRASDLGFAAPASAGTTDPGLCLVVDGRTLRPLAARIAGARETADATVRFVLPERAASVRLKSRRTTAGHSRPWLDDPRILGVAVRSITLRDRAGETVLGADHPALTDGWHPAEFSEGGAPWRWTGGDAALPIVSDGPCLLEITLNPATAYYEDGHDGGRLAA